MYLPPFTQGNSTNGLGNTFPTQQSIGGGCISVKLNEPRPVSSGKIHDAMGFTEELLDIQYKLLQELESRLSYILSPTGPDGVVGATSNAPPSNSPVLERVASTNGRLLNLNGMVSSIMNRLEV